MSTRSIPFCFLRTEGLWLKKKKDPKVRSICYAKRRQGLRGAGDCSLEGVTVDFMTFRRLFSCDSQGNSKNRSIDFMTFWCYPMFADEKESIPASRNRLS